MSATTRPPNGLPLAGVTLAEIVDPEAPPALAHAAALAGRIAADLGARVVRLESIAPTDPDLDIFLNAGKQRLRVQPGVAKSLASDLCRRADAVICDAATHASAPADATPFRVVLRMARDAPNEGSEFTIEARAGLLDLVGDRAGSPLRLAGHQTAYAGGLAAHLALVTGLVQRSAGLPVGTKHVDLLDVAVWLNWKTIVIATRTGASPSRAGPDSEWTVLPCADGFFALVYRVPEWPNLKRLVADPRLDEERFETVAGRRENRPALNAILAEAFAARSRADIRAQALASKLPLGPVWTPEELLRDPHMVARRFFAPTAVGDRVVPMPRLPVKWNGASIDPALHAEPAATLDLAG